MDFLKQHLLSNSIFLLGQPNFHFDTRVSLLGSSKALHQAAVGIWSKIKQLSPDVIVGKGAGSAPLISAVKLIAWLEDSKELVALMVRDSRKNRSPSKKLIDGPLPQTLPPGARAVFIDDLISQGTTYDFVVAALEEEEFQVNLIAIAVVVDFWYGSRRLSAQGLPVYSLYTRHDLGITRKDSNLPTILNDMSWHLIRHHSGINYMPLKSPPVIDNNKIYIGNDNGHQYCYDLSTGDLLWKYESTSPQLKGTVSQAQIVSGKVYWTSYDGTVRCADAETGQHYWAAKPDRNLHSSPCIDVKNNRLFIGTEFNKLGQGYGEGDIVALNLTTGVELWRFPTLNMVPGTPLYVPSCNTVWAPSNDFFVYALDADTGHLKEKIPTKGEVKGKPVFDPATNTVIFISNYGYAYGIDAETNTVKWQRKIAASVTHNFPYIENSIVYFSTDGGFVVAVSADDGSVVWITQLRGPVVWGIIDAVKCLIAVTRQGYVVFLDKVTGKKLASDIIKTSTRVEIYQPPAYYNGKLVISTNTSGIMCYNINIDKILSNEL